MISREKTFAFCCFEISKGINFREKGPKTRKTRKFLPTKVSALKVEHINNIRLLTKIHAFFISNAFIDSTRLKLAKNRAKAKQHAEAELLLLENFVVFSSTLSSKDNKTSTSI